MADLQKINPNIEQQDHHLVASVQENESDKSTMEDSSNSASFSSSSSSTDLTEDASSSTSHSNNGPLYELSELMDQLPIKRGLSRFYQGKSQSYTTLARVKSIEDLAKKVISPCKSKMKSCKSYAGLVLEAKPTISKKPSTASSSSLAFFKQENSIGN